MLSLLFCEAYQLRIFQYLLSQRRVSQQCQNTTSLKLNQSFCEAMRHSRTNLIYQSAEKSPDPRLMHLFIFRDPGHLKLRPPEPPVFAPKSHCITSLTLLTKRGNLGAVNLNQGQGQNPPHLSSINSRTLSFYFCHMGCSETPSDPITLTEALSLAFCPRR